MIEFPTKHGPRTELSDEKLLTLIREVIDESPFSGEGHSKVTAYLRRKKKADVGRKRVHRIMRANGLLAPQRDKKRRKARPHDGTNHPGEPGSAVGHGRDQGVDQERRLGVGVLLHRPLLGRSVDLGGQARRPFCQSRADLRCGHRSVRESGQGPRPRDLVAPRLGTPIHLRSLPGRNQI